MRHLSAILALWAGITACAQAAGPQHVAGPGQHAPTARTGVLCQRVADKAQRDVGERVTGIGIFETNDSGDVAGCDLVDIFTFVGVHTDDTADTLFFTGCGVDDVATSV